MVDTCCMKPVHMLTLMLPPLQSLKWSVVLKMKALLVFTLLLAPCVFCRRLDRVKRQEELGERILQDKLESSWVPQDDDPDFRHVDSWTLLPECGVEFECVDAEECDEVGLIPEFEFKIDLRKEGDPPKNVTVPCQTAVGGRGTCCRKSAIEVCLFAQLDEACVLGTHCPNRDPTEPYIDLREYPRSCINEEEPTSSSVCCDFEARLPVVPSTCGFRGGIPAYDPMAAVSPRRGPVEKRTRTEFAEFPWQALIFSKDAGPEAQYRVLGEGVLISDRHILTTGAQLQRFNGSAEYLRIRLGEWKRGDVAEPLPHQDYRVLRVDMQEFQPKDFQLAILTLGRGVHITNNVHMVCLPEIGETFGDCLDYTSTGWEIEEVEDLYQRMVELKDVSAQSCLSAFEELRPLKEYITCGSNKNLDVCTSHEGSPVVCHKGDSYVVTGLYVNQCGEDASLAVFRSICDSETLKWIHSILDENQLHYKYPRSENGRLTPMKPKNIWDKLFDSVKKRYDAVKTEIEDTFHGEKESRIEKFLDHKVKVLHKWKDSVFSWFG